MLSISFGWLHEIQSAWFCAKNLRQIRIITASITVDRMQLIVGWLCPFKIRAALSTQYIGHYHQRKNGEITVIE